MEQHKVALAGGISISPVKDSYLQIRFCCNKELYRLLHPLPAAASRASQLDELVPTACERSTPADLLPSSSARRAPPLLAGRRRVEYASSPSATRWDSSAECLVVLTEAIQDASSSRKTVRPPWLSTAQRALSWPSPNTGISSFLNCNVVLSKKEITERSTRRRTARKSDKASCFGEHDEMGLWLQNPHCLGGKVGRVLGRVEGAVGEDEVDGVALERQRRSSPATTSGGERFFATATASETPSSRSASASCAPPRQTAREAGARTPSVRWAASTAAW
ncbi:hypothetical protein EJB05_37252, partial [Eragrostis curvula]